MTQTPPTKTINLDILSETPRYIRALAHDLEDLDEKTPDHIIEHFILWLPTEVNSPFLASTASFPVVVKLIKDVGTMLESARKDDDWLNEERRFEIANELFPVIVEALLPHAIRDEPPLTGPFYRTVIVYEILSREPLGEEDDLSDIHHWVSEGINVSGHWIEVTQENIDGPMLVALLANHSTSPDEFGLDEEGKPLNLDKEDDNTELAIQVAHESQKALEEILTEFNLALDHVVEETPTENVLVYFIEETYTQKNRENLLTYLEEQERIGWIKIRQDRALW